MQVPSLSPALMPNAPFHQDQNVPGGPLLPVDGPGTRKMFGQTLLVDEPGVLLLWLVGDVAEQLASGAVCVCCGHSVGRTQGLHLLHRHPCA